jgi:hypothetical protein
MESCELCEKKAELFVCSECGGAFCDRCLSGNCCKVCAKEEEQKSQQTTPLKPIKEPGKIIRKWYSAGYLDGFLDLAKKINSLETYEDIQKYLEEIIYNLKDSDFPKFLETALKRLTGK